MKSECKQANTDKKGVSVDEIEEKPDSLSEKDLKHRELPYSEDEIDE